MKGKEEEERREISRVVEVEEERVELKRTSFPPSHPSKISVPNPSILPQR